MKYSEDVFYNTVSTFLSLGLTWFITLLIVRLGNFEAAGILSLAMTVGSVYFPLATFSSRTFILADVQKDFRDSSYLYLRIITMVVSFFSCTCISALFNYSFREWLSIGFYFVFMLTEAAEDIVLGIYQRGNMLAHAGKLGCGRALVFFMAFIATMYLTHDVLVAIVVMAVCSWAYVVFVENNRMLQRFPDVWSHDSHIAKSMRNLLVLCIPLMAYVFLSNASRAVPRLVFRTMCASEEYGIFSSVSTITLIFSTAVMCLLVPLIPKFAEYYLNDDIRKLKKIAFVSFSIIIGLGFLAFPIAFIAGKPVLSVCFGPEVVGYMDVFYWTLVSVFLHSITIVQYYILVGARKQKEIILGAVFCIVVCAVLSYPLCRNFYMNGIAFVLIAAYLVQIAYYTIVIADILKRKTYNI